MDDDQDPDVPVEMIELGKTLLAAARAGNIKAVVELTRYNAPFSTDWWGLTALHLAAQAGHVEMVKLLIKFGIPRDAQSKVDKTPLHLACQEGHEEVVKFLVSNGADVEATDLVYMTPLHWAVEGQHLGVVKILLQNGANPYVKDKFERTCFDMAEDQNNQLMLQLLREVYNLKEKRKSPENNKRKIIVNNFSSKANTGGGAEAVKKVVLQKNVDEDIWHYLEEHGIEMLEGEDVNLVAAAVESGQSVVLTEAGRQALILSETPKQRTIAPANSVEPEEEPNDILSDAVQSLGSHPNDAEIEALSELSKKYSRAKNEADRYYLLFVKKKREAAAIYNNLLEAIKAVKNDNTGLPSDEEELGEEEEWVEADIDES